MLLLHIQHLKAVVVVAVHFSSSVYTFLLDYLSSSCAVSLKRRSCFLSVTVSSIASNHDKSDFCNNVTQKTNNQNK